jgi:hypothetical protein
MADAAEYEARIQQLDWVGLRSLWANIGLRDTPDWDPGLALEYLILRAFQLDGARMRWPYSILLENEMVEQIDGAVRCGRLSCLVETKDTSLPISVEPIAKMHLFVRVWPTDSAADVLKAVKGVTSHELRQKHPPLRKMPAIWTRSYFASTAGNVSQATIRRYIAALKGP